MNVELNQRRVTDAAEFVNLAGLDDEDVARAALELDPIDLPEAPTFPHELNLVVRVAMGARTPSGERAEEESGDVDLAVIGPDEFERVEMNRQVALSNPVHRASSAMRVSSPRLPHDRDDVRLDLAVHCPSPELIRDRLGRDGGSFGQA
jgi:hypothetical protein